MDSIPESENVSFPFEGIPGSLGLCDFALEIDD